MIDEIKKLREHSTLLESRLLEAESFGVAKDKSEKNLKAYCEGLQNEFTVFKKEISLEHEEHLSTLKLESDKQTL